MSQYDGDIVFKSPTKEFLRLRGSDGAILVEGRVAAKDDEVVNALRQWLKGAASKTLPDGNVVISSGMGVGSSSDAHGKDVTLLA